MQLKLLNLPRTFDEKAVKQLFSEYGKVISCTLVKDEVTGASKGFGFLEMEDEESANKAIEAIHKKKFKGARIRVKPTE